MKTLVIVESPAKAEKIQGYLGKDYIVLASKGHITDLAKGGRFGLGVDIDKDFRPHYVLQEDKIDTLDMLLKATKKCDNILIASDPDREGEAIAWHLQERLKDTGLPIKRVVFNEIKKDKVQKAIKSPRDVDINLFHSQEARRILDRLVGFMASPFLMNYFGPKLSAGRVQSVVTRMVIDREREIEAFVPETFWTISVMLAPATNMKHGFMTKFNGRPTDEELADDFEPRYFTKAGDFSRRLEDKSYNPIVHRTKGADINDRYNVVEYIGCGCGATIWAFNNVSVQKRPEITSRKGRYKYPQKFSY